MRTDLMYGKIPRFYYKAIDAYVEVDDPENWLPCPKCNRIPLVWEFNNGRKTACGCGKDDYDHHSIHAESVMSVISRSATKVDATEYKVNELRDNWNHWVKTGEELFVHAGKRTDGR